MLKQADYDKLLMQTRRQKNIDRLATFLIFGGFGLLLLLQMKGVTASTYGLIIFMLINIGIIINLNQRSSKIHSTMRSFNHLSLPNTMEENEWNEFKNDMRDDIYDPLMNERKFNTKLLYSICALTTVFCIIVIVDYFMGGYRLYSSRTLIMNIFYFGYIAFFVVLYRLMFKSEKRINFIAEQFLSYTKTFYKLQQHQ